MNFATESQIAQEIHDLWALINRDKAEIERLRTIEKAAINLCQVRGRHHSEIAMNQLMQVCGFETAKDET